MASHVDTELLRELGELMEDDFGMLLHTYLEESTRQFAAASRAWQAGDSETLRRNVHSLKGSSLNIGAFALSALCAQLEALARNNSPISGLLEQAAMELSAVQAELGDIYQNL